LGEQFAYAIVEITHEIVSLLDVATAPGVTQKNAKNQSQSAFAFLGFSQLVVRLYTEFNVDDANNSEADSFSLYRLQKRHKRISTTELH
jgi:hypothetical protein